MSKDVTMEGKNNGPSSMEQSKLRANTKPKKEKWMRNGCLVKKDANPM
jgi:hypothetical protein